jgi:hypothetical protein
MKKGIKEKEKRRNNEKKINKKLITYWAASANPHPAHGAFHPDVTPSRAATVRGLALIGASHLSVSCACLASNPGPTGQVWTRSSLVRPLGARTRV